MPGPSKVRGEQAMLALETRKIDESLIDMRVRNVLNLINYCMQNGTPEDAPEEGIDSPETSKKLREIGAATQVLLKNERGVLPFRKDKTVRRHRTTTTTVLTPPQVAVIGPNAKIAAYSGGGSASLRPYYTVTPFAGISSQAKDVKYALGAQGFKGLPVITDVSKTPSGKPGLLGKVYTTPPSSQEAREQVDELYIEKSDLLLVDYANPKLGPNYWIDFLGTVTPDEDGDFVFGLSVAGTAKLFLDGKLLIDNATKQRSGDSFFGSGTVEEQATLAFVKGKKYNVKVEFGSSGTSTLHGPGVTPMGGGGLRLGMTRIVDPQEEIDKAVALAESVDQVVIIAGTNVRMPPSAPPSGQIATN